MVGGLVVSVWGTVMKKNFLLKFSYFDSLLCPNVRVKLWHIMWDWCPSPGKPACNSHVLIHMYIPNEAI